MSSNRSYRPPPGGDLEAEAAVSRRTGLFGGDEEGQLFGRSSVAPPAARRAASRTTGARPVTEVGAPSLVPLAPPPSFELGQRDEDSVLFSVADIAKQRATSHASAAQRPAAPPQESEGMVDLLAMAAPAAAPMGDIPPFMEHPQPAPSMFASIQPPAYGTPGGFGVPGGYGAPAASPAKPALPWVLGGAAVAVLSLLGVVVVAVFWLRSGHDDLMLASADMPPQAPAPIEREIVRRSKVEGGGETASATAPAATRRPAPRKSTGSAATNKGSAGKGAASAKPKKSSDPCNCKGVLACVIRCTK